MQVLDVLIGIDAMCLGVVARVEMKMQNLDVRVMKLRKYPRQTVSLTYWE